mmetsp:Transcript_40616/g.129548  ORF Transcript_40616/g.129548 Transcript_40616/m.129548 type:complete len:210 (-) Transcript_40616:1780-2409(-)
MNCLVLLKIARPSATAATMVAKLSSASTMSAAPLATAVPEPMAMPMSLFLSAGASLTPSPVMATTSLPLRRMSTSLVLCEGSTRLNTPMVATASTFSASDSSSNSVPVYDLPVPVVSWVGSSTPMRRHTASAVPLLSPVTTMTRMPAARHVSMAPATSSRGGSTMPTRPRKVSPLSSRASTCACPCGIGLSARASTRMLFFSPYTRTRS